MANLPLKGKRIVITRSVSAGDDWEKYLKKQGAIVYKFPCIKITPAPLTPGLRRVLAGLQNFRWIIFTSPTGPYLLKKLMDEIDSKISPKDMPAIATIGKKTTEAVRKAGYRVAFTPKTPASLALGYELYPLRSPILLLRADIASSKLPNILKARGAEVREVSIYKTTLSTEAPSLSFSKLLRERKIDLIIFASPSAVRGFSARIKTALMKRAVTIPAVAIGPRVAFALQRYHFRDVRTASQATIESARDAIL